MSESRQADSIWRTCFDCDVRVRLSDFKSHLSSHIERPEGEPFTIPEVSKALGIPLRTTYDMVQDGRIPGIVKKGAGTVGPKGGEPTVYWVPRAVLAAYVSEVLAKHPEKAVIWAETGRLG